MQASSRLFSKIFETDLFKKIQSEIAYRFQIDDSLAYEMAQDFLDLLLTNDTDSYRVDQ